MQRETKWKLRIEEPLQLGEKWFVMEENSKVKVYGCRRMRGEVLGLGDGENREEVFKNQSRRNLVES